MLVSAVVWTAELLLIMNSLVCWLALAIAIGIVAAFVAVTAWLVETVDDAQERIDNE